MSVDVAGVLAGLADIYTGNLTGTAKTKAMLVALEHLCNAARDDGSMEFLRERVAQKLGCTVARATEVLSLIGDAAGELK